jgi:hypothetical protein
MQAVDQRNQRQRPGGGTKRSTALVGGVEVFEHGGLALRLGQIAETVEGVAGEDHHSEGEGAHFGTRMSISAKPVPYKYRRRKPSVCRP